MSSVDKTTQALAVSESLANSQFGIVYINDISKEIGFCSLNGADENRTTDLSDCGFLTSDAPTYYGGPDEEAVRLAGAPSVCKPRFGLPPILQWVGSNSTVTGAS